MCQGLISPCYPQFLTFQVLFSASSPSLFFFFKDNSSIIYCSTSHWDCVHYPPPPSSYSLCFRMHNFDCNAFTFTDPFSHTFPNLLLIPFSIFFIPKSFACIFFFFASSFCLPVMSDFWVTSWHIEYIYNYDKFCLECWIFVLLLVKDHCAFSLRQLSFWVK